MKKRVYAHAVFAAVFTLLIILASCPGPGLGTGNVDVNPYEGTVWRADSGMAISFVSGAEWQLFITGSFASNKGTYTYDLSGNSITLTTTHFRMNPDDDWEPAPPETPQPGKGIASDNTFLCGNQFYFKEGGGGAGLYNGTGWKAADGETFAFVSGAEYRMTDGSGTFRGRYNHIGSLILFTPEEVSVNEGAGWNPVENVEPFDGIVLDGSLAVGNRVFAKQGGQGGAGPYYGTAWKPPDLTGYGTLSKRVCSFMSDTDYLLRSTYGATRGTYTVTNSGVIFTETHESLDYGASWTPVEGKTPLSGFVLGDGMAINMLICFNQDANAGGSGPYYRTIWYGSGGVLRQIVFVSDTEWLMTEEAYSVLYKGTYTHTGSSITLTKTHTAANDGSVDWKPAEDAPPETNSVTNNEFEFDNFRFIKME